MSNLASHPNTYENRKQELLDGKLIFMSPRPAVRHNLVMGNLYAMFKNFLKGKPCTPFADGTDVHLTDKDRVIPDVMVICDKSIVKADGVHGVPDLVVEVLSPGTAQKDRGYKKDLYEKCGVKEYWIVDPENRSVEVYLPVGGKFTLACVYSIFPDYVVEMMSEEERANIQYTFAPSLFPDMNIVLEDVFESIV